MALIVKSMGLYSGGLTIGGIFASEVFFFLAGGGGGGGGLFFGILQDFSYL